MAEIQQACKDGEIHQFAHIGDTISDGTYTYTVIGINQDKPSDASGNLLNSSKYGDVLTVMPLGARQELQMDRRLHLICPQHHGEQQM